MAVGNLDLRGWANKCLTRHNICYIKNKCKYLYYNHIFYNQKIAIKYYFIAIKFTILLNYRFHLYIDIKDSVRGISI